jgi:hypothetical protein
MSEVISCGFPNCDQSRVDLTAFTRPGNAPFTLERAPIERAAEPKFVFVGYVNVVGPRRNLDALLGEGSGAAS